MEMVGGDSTKPQGRRGSKKARSKAAAGGTKHVKAAAGGGRGGGGGEPSLPVVSDSRFSSMHNAPVSVGLDDNSIAEDMRRALHPVLRCVRVKCYTAISFCWMRRWRVVLVRTRTRYLPGTPVLG